MSCVCVGYVTEMTGVSLVGDALKVGRLVDEFCLFSIWAHLQLFAENIDNFEFTGVDIDFKPKVKQMRCVQDGSWTGQRVTNSFFVGAASLTMLKPRCSSMPPPRG